MSAAVIKVALKCKDAMPGMTGHDILFILVALHVPLTPQSATVTVLEAGQSE